VTVLALAGLAATWQQGFLEDGLNELRRYGANAGDGAPLESAVSSGKPLEPEIGGVFTFPEGWALDVSGEDERSETEGGESPTSGSQRTEGRGRILAETPNATLFAGSTTGVEPSDVVMAPILAAENTADTEGVLGDGVDINIEAFPEAGEFILTLTLSEEPFPDALPGVWHVDDSGRAQLILGVWDADANTITIQVEQFSGFWSGWWNPVNWIVEGADFLFDYFTGRTDPPPCGEEPSWATLTMQELSSVHVCLQTGNALDGWERAELIIKSNRRTMQLVEFPREAVDLWVQPHQSEWIRKLLVTIAESIEVGFFNSPSRSDSAALLFGGKTMTYKVERSRDDLNLESHADLTAALVIANLLLGLVGALDIIELLAFMIPFGGCVGNILSTAADVGVSELAAYVQPVLTCVLNALKDPEGTARETERAARVARLSDDAVRKAGESVENTLTSGRMRGVSQVLSRVTTISTTATTIWDSTFDYLAEGRMTLSIEGDPGLPSRSRRVPIDYDEIEKTTGETPVILIADISGSMDDRVNGSIKLELAKRAMLDFLTSVSSTRAVALRSYPADGRQNCNSGELQFGFSPKRSEMELIINDLRAGGDTPTAEALRAAVDDISWAGFSQAEIALFSDGLANCGDPCEIAEQIGGSDSEIRVHVGAFVDSAEGRQALKCIADETEGTYTEGSDGETDFGEELGEFLERNSKPRLEVTVEAPESVVPLTGPSGEQRVATSIRNDSNVAAKDVVLLLETRDGVGRRRDSLAVGNVAPGGESTVTWRLRPGFEDVGTVLDVVLAATAANTDEVVSSAVSVAVEDPNVADEAGPILGVGQIVVMGDQLLSGVGTSTRGPYGGCRRSRNIGLLEVFGQPAERSLACANALMAHLAAPDWAKDVDSQVNQLVDLREGEGAISAVVLSIGATDFGLSELARECVMSNVPCDSEIAGVPTEEWLGESVAGGGPRHAAASAELVRALGTVDEALNQTRDRSRGTRQVPILLLAQPRAFPFVHGACFERWQGEDLPLMTQPELNLYHHFVSVVNGTLEAAAVASQDLGLPVFYVDTTESAYLPDHTACAAEPYVQSLEPLVEAGSRGIKTLSEGGVAAVAGGEFNEDTLVELGEEFLVPNEYGEQALANAVLRWSQSDEAREADDFVSDEFQRRSAGIAPRVSEPTPGEIWTFSQPGRAAIEPGRGWTASTSGFLPGALVTASVVPGERVVASAVADENGTAELYVAVPRDIAAGDVTLVARGVSRSGEAISVEQPARVLPPLRPIHSVALPALAVLLLLSSVGLWRVSRRTVTVAAPLRDES